MKGLWVGIGLAVLAAVAAAPAPAANPPGDDRKAAERYIVQAEGDWASSVATGDTATVERILADDFLGMSPEGQLYDRAAAIADTRASAPLFLSNRVGDVKIRFFGDTAVAQGSETWTRRAGAPATGRFVWTDTWLRRKGVWRIVASEDLIAPASEGARPHYGSNPSAGAYFTHDGVKLYYEVYGAGEPLLMIHGNSADIWSLGAQIDYFRQKYRVIVMDSRDHGRSADAPGPLTFEAMADDLSAVLDHVQASPAYVLGWSDGGIEALLLGIRHPGQVKMIAAMAANLDPGGGFVQQAAPPATAKDAEVSRAERVHDLDRDEPHIKPEALEAITAPTLVLASDHDLIRDEHTLLIYHHLQNGELAIFPGATHMIPFDDPMTFNATVDRFFSTPFVKKDRLGDAMKTIGKMIAAHQAEQ